MFNSIKKLTNLRKMKCLFKFENIYYRYSFSGYDKRIFLFIT